jgi:hypothetical protein
MTASSTTFSRSEIRDLEPQTKNSPKVQELAFVLLRRHIINTGVMNEHYFDPRAKASATQLFGDIPPLSRCQSLHSVQQLHTQYVHTEYGRYFKYTTIASSSSDVLKLPSIQPESSSWKRKFSIPSPFKKSPTENKRPADLMNVTPSPRRSSSSPSKSFSPFSRPLFIRRNAWRGKAVDDGDSEGDALMADAEQAAASESQPEHAAAAAAQGRLIDVSSPKEQRPKKRPRLLHAPSFLERFSKFDLAAS